MIVSDLCAVQSKNDIMAILAGIGDELAEPKFRALAERLGALINEGRLAEDDFLPSQRIMSYHCGVSPQTVASAYAELARKGFVVGETGRGTRVIGALKAFKWAGVFEPTDLEALDLATLQPAFGPIHVRAIEDALDQVKQQNLLLIFSACRDALGLAEHRKSGCEWLRNIGLEYSPEEIAVTNGATHGIQLAARTMFQFGDAVALGRASDIGHLAVTHLFNLKPIPIAVDEEGIIPSDLEDKARQHPIRGLILTPSINNPNVGVMSYQRRCEIIEIAHRRDLRIIEDDCFSQLLDAPPPSLVSLSPDRVAYVTSLTKPLFRGLRTGYLRLPLQFMRQAELHMRSMVTMACPIAAAISSVLISSGRAAELIDWQKGELKARHRSLQGSLGDYGLVSIPQSLHAYLPVPSPWTTAQLVQAIARNNILVTAPDAFIVSEGGTSRFVRICLGGAISRAQIEKAGVTIRELLTNPPEPANSAVV